MPRARLVTAAATLTAFGALTAAAATLGGLNSASLGADQTIVAACDSDGIALSYVNVYDGVSNSYKTTSVTLNNVATGCTGMTYKLALSNGTNSLAENTGVVIPVGGSQTVTLSTPLDTKSVTKAAIVITG